MQETPFAELSVSTISIAPASPGRLLFLLRLQIAVLAQILGEAAEELEELTH